MAIQEIEKNFYQFICECCSIVGEGAKHKKAEIEMLAELEVIKEKLGDEGQKLGNALLDRISYLETTIQDDHFKAGFMAGVKLGQ